jgi:hypothetical protein
MNDMVGKILRINDLSVLFFPMNITSVYGYKDMFRGELIFVLKVITMCKGRVFNVLCKHGIGIVVETTDIFPARKIDYEVVA